MREIKITKPIIIGNKIQLAKSTFEGSAIYQEGVEVIFKCPSCNAENSLLLNENTGDLLDNLFLKHNIITKNEIIKNGLAKENSKINRHLGELVVFPNLTALHSFVECNQCKSNFIVVFSFGEAQPGRNICFLSGIWKISHP